MFAAIKHAYKAWRAERSRTKALYAALENLTDPTFLDRAIGGTK